MCVGCVCGGGGGGRAGLRVRREEMVIKERLCSGTNTIKSHLKTKGSRLTHLTHTHTHELIHFPKRHAE